MSRRSRTSGVRGPNSALTEFLRNAGITDAFRARREREATDGESTANGSDQDVQEVLEEEGDTVVEAEVEMIPTRRRSSRRNRVNEAEVEEDEEIKQIKIAAIKKRKMAKRGGNGDDDDEFDDPDFSEFEDEIGTNGMKRFGEEDTCVDCGTTFHLTVYSRFLKEKQGYICENCNETLKVRERKARKNQLNARKRRRTFAQALLNKSEVKIPKLQDICIKKISANISDVDALGDIGQVNLNKLSQILSKNRSLNDDTISLFLNPSLKSIEFWDCSNVDSDSYSKIASFCPNVESLTLFMCGQLHNDNLKYYTTNLKNLKNLSLNGPFLISDSMWQEYFEESGSRFEKFEIRNTHRFGNDSLISLLENSGSKLSSLKLSRLDGLDSEAVYDLIPHYLSPSTLTELEISYPHTEDIVTNDLLINILAITGESLQSLNVDGCTSLTDRFLLEGVARFCPNLTHLSMKLLDQVTDEGFAQAFDEFSKVNNGGLLSVDVTKCIGLSDNAIYSLLKHSSHTLIELSLNSLHQVTKDFFLQVFTDDLTAFKKSRLEMIEQQGDDEPEDEDEDGDGDHKKLQYFSHVRLPLLTTWDCGFVRAVDDEILDLIGKSCPKLSILEVYGNNKCTSKANIVDGLMVIGRQNDQI
ncbi:putative DNA repair protein [Scheffersomyces coipomensis]|uniref:putative DNA repair protein n=1 Tax=Scheffersomyces coipomensis TaxID=1788519 RepID=UPI00315C923E